jgi:hypothetical protein
METKFLKDALFGGMTSNAFKLGTVLSLGWFWVRVHGCTILYRGGRMRDINFEQIPAADEISASQISPPTYLSHGSDSTWFYIVRRANGNGDEEKTLRAAVKVATDSDGDLVGAAPNALFAVAFNLRGDRLEMVWRYSEICQGQRPVCFRIYSDGGTGQVDYEIIVGAVNYHGRRFYFWMSEPLGQGRYLFSIKAAGSDGGESYSKMFLSMQIGASVLNVPQILKAEVV